MSQNNNGFIAAIVSQSGGGGEAQLNNDASTIVEKYQTPVVRPNDRMAEPEEDKMSNFGEPEMLPTLWLTDKQLPSADGLVVGDKVCFEIEADVSGFSYNENSDGSKRREYTFRLKKGFVKKELD